MTHPLDGAKLKVIRAHEHLDALKIELESFFKTDEHGFITKRNGDQLTIVSETGFVEIPKRLGLIVGDAAANLRAALDYTMWELAERYFDPSCDLSNPGDLRITAFPIAVSPTDQGYFDRLKRLQQRKFPTSAINVINSVQPHNAGYEPLGWLHHLVNRDKHRSLTLMLAPVIDASIAFRKADWLHVLPRQPVIGGRTFEAPPGWLDAVDRGEMQMQIQGAVLVTFADQSMPLEPLERTMWQIATLVSEIVPRFLDLF